MLSELNKSEFKAICNIVTKYGQRSLLAIALELAERGALYSSHAVETAAGLEPLLKRLDQMAARENN